MGVAYMTKVALKAYLMPSMLNKMERLDAQMLGILRMDEEDGMEG